MRRSPLDVNQPFVTRTGFLAPQAQEAMEEIVRWIPIIGSGSPEGVVLAMQYSLYIDKDGTTGAIEYRKMLPDVGGDKTKGWVLV